MKKSDIFKTFMELRPNSTFISISEYKNNRNEISNFGIVFHASYQNVLFKSLSIVSMFVPKNKTEEEAKFAIVKSLTKRLMKLSKPIEEKEKDVYKHFKDADGKIISGIKFHKENKELHISGLEVKKEIISVGDLKKVKSKPLTKAKNKILALTPLSKWRQFKLEPNKFKEIKVEGFSILPEADINSVKVD